MVEAAENEEPTVQNATEDEHVVEVGHQALQRGL
jgi:hypothetical protein